MKAAVAPSKGIGDGLMMLVAAQALRREGYQVTLFSTHLHELSEWFPDIEFSSTPGDWERFDRIVAQFDYTPERQDLFQRDDVAIFYPVYNPNRCPPLKEIDRVFSADKTMVENIAEAMGSTDMSNGITPLPGLTHRKEKQRVVIHPTSTDPVRTWSAKKFVKLAQKLKRDGFEPVFAVAPHERDAWEGPPFATLSELAVYLYESGYFIGNESGTSHLASCLGIPTLVIAGDKRRIAMWKPGWAPGEVVVPPDWVPNFKGLRLRTDHWQWFISTSDVMKVFTQILV